MTHIFCGKISRGEARGLHCLSSQTDWDLCARVERCTTLPTTNLKCEDVLIYDSRDLDWELKIGASTIWPLSRTPDQLVSMFQSLYNRCKPKVDDVALCFPKCHWRGNSNAFDIVIGTEKRESIVTAYPAAEGECSKFVEFQDCDSVHCQNL